MTVFKDEDEELSPLRGVKMQANESANPYHRVPHRWGASCDLQGCVPDKSPVAEEPAVQVPPVWMEPNWGQPNGTHHRRHAQIASCAASPACQPEQAKEKPVARRMRANSALRVMSGPVEGMALHDIPHWEDAYCRVSPACKPELSERGPDPEIMALGLVSDALERLEDPAARGRVLRWASSRFAERT